LTDKIERKILEAFDAIHALGVMHNDIRAENILVSNQDGSVWVIDFEFATVGNSDLAYEYERSAVVDVLSEIKGKGISHGYCGDGVGDFRSASHGVITKGF
jgi:RIO-like serine/threonine protein kinase